MRAPGRSGNGMGVAGFVLALISLFICWIPVVGWITWVLGAVFSFVGVLKPGKGLAIAGLVLTLIDLILLLALAGVITSLGLIN